MKPMLKLSVLQDCCEDQTMKMSFSILNQERRHKDTGNQRLQNVYYLQGWFSQSHEIGSIASIFQMKKQIKNIK